MKKPGGIQVLSALLAAVAVGMGVQTYAIVRLHRQLEGAPVARAAEGPAPAETTERGDEPTPPAAARPIDPFARLEQSQERMRSLLDDFEERFGLGLGQPSGHEPFALDGDSFLFGAEGLLGPRVDLQDRGDRYQMVVDVPGTDEADVVVTAEDGMLTIEGTRAASVDESEPGSFVRRERHFGRFERRISLPSDADPGTLETELESGVLTVTLAKRS